MKAENKNEKEVALAETQGAQEQGTRVLDWIRSLGLEVDVTISKRAQEAIVKKKYGPSSFGFDRHGEKIARVRAWAVAENNGKEYKVVIHTPKRRDGLQVARTFYRIKE